MVGKKLVASVNYEICKPEECDFETGICRAIESCSYKSITQLDGAFDKPFIFQEMCLGCGSCLETCPVNAISIINKIWKI